MFNEGEMGPAKTKIPVFKSEKEEAEWWDAHPEVVTALFLKGKKEGKIKRVPVVRGATRSTTIRLSIADTETAQQIAEKRGLPYQTYLKGLLHQALERERKAG
jgi:predicted DNA binding CopG/RHH family protein